MHRLKRAFEPSPKAACEALLSTVVHGVLFAAVVLPGLGLDSIPWLVRVVLAVPGVVGVTTVRFMVVGLGRGAWYLSGAVLAVLILALVVTLVPAVDQSAGSSVVRQLEIYSLPARLGLVLAGAVTGLTVSALGVYPGLIAHLLWDARRDRRDAGTGP